MKKLDKYKYVTGKQITRDESRIYDIAGHRLPSVTTILDKTKDKSFLTRWKAKVGEEEAERIKNHSSRRGTAMHKFIESFVEGVGYDDLTTIGQEAKPMAEKIIEMGLAPVDTYLDQRSCYIILGYTLGLLTWYVFTMIWKLL